jgi:hypothetical protein
MDVLAKNAKREDGLQLVILKEPHFAYRCFCYFLCFCCLRVMEFGVLIFMECRHPNKMLVVEHYFLDFFCLVVHDLLRGEKKAFGERKR